MHSGSLQFIVGHHNEDGYVTSLTRHQYNFKFVQLFMYASCYFHFFPCNLHILYIPAVNMTCRKDTFVLDVQKTLLCVTGRLVLFGGC